MSKHACYTSGLSDIEHPSKELTSKRFPADVYLRRRGWRIYSRPCRGEPLWEKAGEVVPQSEAERRER